jgi:hypothetical protein
LTKSGLRRRWICACRQTRWRSQAIAAPSVRHCCDDFHKVPRRSACGLPIANSRTIFRVLWSKRPAANWGITISMRVIARQTAPGQPNNRVTTGTEAFRFARRRATLAERSDI